MKIAFKCGVLVLCGFLTSEQAFSNEIIPPPKPSIQVKANDVTKKIDLNSATAKDIARNVKGIGMRRAGFIVEYRKSNGRLKNIEELIFVPGFSKTFVDKRLAYFKQVLTVK